MYLFLKNTLNNRVTSFTPPAKTNDLYETLLEREKNLPTLESAVTLWKEQKNGNVS